MEKKRKRKGRKKILSNKVFCELWNCAGKVNDKKEYIKTFTSPTSCKYIDFKRKFNLEYEEVLYMLNEIYEKQHISFKEILNIAKKRKSDISNTFCIPIRTVEEWYTGKNVCNNYIRLMIMRQYHLLNLGKYIYVEADEEYISTSPNIYQKSKKDEKPNQKTAITKEDKKNNEDIYMEYEIIDEEVDEDENVEDYKTHDINLILKEYEKKFKKDSSSSVEVRSILSKTDYLSQFIKK